MTYESGRVLSKLKGVDEEQFQDVKQKNRIGWFGNMKVGMVVWTKGLDIRSPDREMEKTHIYDFVYIHRS